MTTMLKVDEFVERGHGVTLISPSPYHYYSGRGFGMLARIYWPDNIRFHVSKVVQDRGGHFVKGPRNAVDPQKGELVLNLGDGMGIFFKKGRVFNRRLAFYLKDHIGKKFTWRFQVSGKHRGEH